MTRTDSAPRSIYLAPAQIAVVREPAVISTVLGSCVSFTFHHRRLGLAGMCHALLPGGGAQEGFRHVDACFKHLLDQFRRQGALGREIEIKLFGGAEMFDAAEGSNCTAVGRQNVAAAMEILRHHDLFLRASDVGGTQGRKLLFHTASGEVFLKRLHRRAPLGEPCPRAVANL